MCALVLVRAASLEPPLPPGPETGRGPEPAPDRGPGPSPGPGIPMPKLRDDGPATAPATPDEDMAGSARNLGL